MNSVKSALLAFAVFVCNLSVQPLPAQEENALDYMSMSLDELASVVVSTVSREEEEAFFADSPVSVLSSDAVLARGPATIGSVLRRAPGVDVGKISSGIWAISSRGLNGQYANRQLVLLDGRQMYTKHFGGVNWDMVDLVLEDLDQIEVVRGPGGSNWGTNAVHGVINVLSKPARETQGGLVTLVAGSNDSRVGVRYGFRLGEDTFGRVSMKYGQFDPTLAAGGGDEKDDWYTRRINARVDQEGEEWIYEFEAGAARNTLGQSFLVAAKEAPFFDFLENPVRSEEWFASVKGKQTGGEFDNTMSWAANAHETDSSPFVVNERRKMMHFYGRQRYWVNDDLLFRASLESRVEKSRGRELDFVTYDPVDRDDWSHGLNVSLSNEGGRGDSVFSAGARLENHSDLGWILLPDFSWKWELSEDAVVWANLTRSARAPDDEKVRIESEIMYYPEGVFFEGSPPVQQLSRANPGLREELYNILQLGGRKRIGEMVTIDASAFYHDLDGLIGRVTGEMDFDSGFQFIDKFNLVEGSIYGGEMTLDWKATEDSLLRFHINKVWQSLDSGGVAFNQSAIGSLPEYTAFLEWDQRIDERWQYGLFARYVGSRKKDEIPGFLRLDASLAWRPSEKTRVVLSAENLLEDGEVEFRNVNAFASSGLSSKWRLTWTQLF